MSKKVYSFKNDCIDNLVLKIGLNELGADKMGLLDSSDIETARVLAFNTLAELTREYGKQKSGTLEKLVVMALNFQLGLKSVEQ